MSDESLKLIKEALTQIALRDEAAITNELENAPEPSEEFSKEVKEKIDKKIKEYEKHVSLKKAITILIAAALLISVFSITAFAGERIKDFFVEIFDDHSNLTVDESGKPSGDYTVEVAYIPDNFVVTMEWKDSISGDREWKCNDAIINLTHIVVSKGTLNIDTENSNYTTIPFENFVVHRTEKYGQINARWTDGKLVYSLACVGVEWEEMVKIIEGIEYREIEKSDV